MTTAGHLEITVAGGRPDKLEHPFVPRQRLSHPQGARSYQHSRTPIFGGEALGLSQRLITGEVQHEMASL